MMKPRVDNPKPFQFEVPVGFCQCGCGEKTPIATKTRRLIGWIKGEPTPYLPLHGKRKPWKKTQDWLRDAVPPNPSGMCLCGCGEKAPIAKQNVKSLGYIKGLPVRYIEGHQWRSTEPFELATVSGIPLGLCGCGCGGATPVAKVNSREAGYVKGQPIRYIRCHSARKNGAIMYVEEDRGYKTKCFIWQWCLSNKGYGNIAKSHHPSGLAHIYMYEKFVGPVPYGLQLDHLCEVKCCVNPEHLEPVTNAENVRRSKKTTKMNHEKVARLREMRAEGMTFAALGRAFNIDRKYAQMIAIGRRWSAI